jgi:hypothetical protein
MLTDKIKRHLLRQRRQPEQLHLTPPALLVIFPRVTRATMGL